MRLRSLAHLSGERALTTALFFTIPKMNPSSVLLDEVKAALLRFRWASQNLGITGGFNRLHLSRMFRTTYDLSRIGS